MPKLKRFGTCHWNGCDEVASLHTVRHGWCDQHYTAATKSNGAYGQRGGG